MNSFGNHIRFTIFGQSHAPCIGAVIDGLPAGVKIDEAALAKFMRRRSPSAAAASTERREEDNVEFIAGLNDKGETCGAPLTLIIPNADARPSDYDALKRHPRPGHADYTAYVKFDGHNDIRGGGQFSGRLTAALCAAGGVCIQLLEKQNIRIAAFIRSIGGIDSEKKTRQPTADQLALLNVLKVKGDSTGGIIECEITGVPAGIGEPMFDGLENRISQAVFAVPGIKGIEFGAGFAGTSMFGSECNDPFTLRPDGSLKTEKNDHGGILGGISSGMPIVFRAAVKPVSSIAMPQHTDSLDGKPILSVGGRHDVCIVPRALPCIEAAAALALADFLL